MNTKGITAAEQAEAATLSEWAENLETLPESATVQIGHGIEPGRAILEAALGSSKALDRALGRPSLNGQAGTGKSPVRHVRIPRDLDALLIQRAAAEERKPSEVVREALASYLKKAS